MTDPTGQIYFFPRGSTFVKVTAVEEKPSLPDCSMHLMRFTDLGDGQEYFSHFAEEIGDEFIPLKTGYDRSRIEEYLKAAKAREDAGATMMDVEIEILCAVD